uniref:Uncharacterized protein n=1 Tax=Tanacetum cinerariifolium TaxID=118510 RepID=A0A6L2LPZ9_TANCI|nr:hypothetical protein [Tanacetum cinerariifolium]
MILNFIDDIQDTDDEEHETNKGGDKGKTTATDEDMSKPFKEVLKCLFTRRIIEFSSPGYKMLTNVKIYDGTGDPEDHITGREEAGGRATNTNKTARDSKRNERKFSKRLGLYNSEEIDEEGFDVYFQGGLRRDEQFNAQEYWLSICQEEYLSLSGSHASTIRNPVLMVLHKMITYGLCKRTTSEVDEEESSW